MVKINWEKIAKELGTIQKLSGGAIAESGGNDYAKQAISKILGENTLKEAVDYYLKSKPGSELARSVLSLIRSPSALNYCFEIYNTNQNIKIRRNTVYLIQGIVDSSALPWVKIFLNDPDKEIQNSGAGVLDQLLWCEFIEPEDCNDELDILKKHQNSSVRERYKFIKNFLKDREE